MASRADVTLSPLISLSDIQHQITELKEMLIEKLSILDTFKKSETSLEHDKANINAIEDQIKLNIGGKIFMTSRSTLVKEESMFSAMFSGRHALKKGNDGAYFIDRDPKHFRKILNFLRDGECVVGHKRDNGAKINPANKKGAYVQEQSMMLSQTGAVHIAGKCVKRLQKQIGKVITVILNCEKRTVEWNITHATVLSESIPEQLQPPFSFCVDLWDSSATIFDLT